MPRLNVKLLIITIAAICIIAAINYRIEKPMKQPILKVAFNFSATAKLDPASIVDMSQYKLLMNLYGRLVAYNENSELQADIPESFRIEGKKIFFTFGNRVKTPNGKSVTAKDAELSIKRLIAFRKSGHGDIRRFLCPGELLKDIEDECQGISTKNNQLILTVVKQHYVPMLLLALESADYSILPQDSIRNSELDLHNSTGPYFLEKIQENGTWNLAANKDHYLYSQNMPAKIELIPTEPMEAEEKFIRKNVDLIPQTMPLTSRAEELIASSESEFHETVPIKVSMILFSPKAIETFTPAQRRFAGTTVAKYLMTRYMEFHAKRTFQFLQSLSGGALTEQEIRENGLDEENPPRPKFERPIEFAVPDAYFEKVEIDFRGYPEIKIIKSKAPAYTLPINERPQIYTLVNDSAWNEDINFLGYNFENKIFYIPGFDSDKWMADFLNTVDPAQRNQKVKALQLQMLKTASLIPYTASPYQAFIRKPWRLNESNIDAGIRFWRIRLE